VGHSERILGRALRKRRREVVIATKFGAHFDERTGQIFDDNPQPEDVQPACEASLRRLQTDYLDVLQLHTGATPSKLPAPFATSSKRSSRAERSAPTAGAPICRSRPGHSREDRAAPACNSARTSSTRSRDCSTSARSSTLAPS